MKKEPTVKKSKLNQKKVIAVTACTPEWPYMPKEMRKKNNKDI